MTKRDGKPSADYLGIHVLGAREIGESRYGILRSNVAEDIRGTHEHDSFARWVASVPGIARRAAIAEQSYARCQPPR
jgi:hypothetical protein